MKDESNLMSYVSNRVQKAKQEVTTSVADMQRLGKYKKSKFDFVDSINGDIHFGMKRRI